MAEKGKKTPLLAILGAVSACAPLAGAVYLLSGLLVRSWPQIVKDPDVAKDWKTLGVWGAILLFVALVVGGWSIAFLVFRWGPRRKAWHRARVFTAAQSYEDGCKTLLDALHAFAEEADLEFLPNRAAQKTFQRMARVFLENSPLWLRHPATEQIAREDPRVARMRDMARNIRDALRQQVYDPVNSDRPPEEAIKEAGAAAKRNTRPVDDLLQFAQKVARECAGESPGSYTGCPPA